MSKSERYVKDAIEGNPSQDYDIKRLLGKGAFGHVSLGRSKKDGSNRALKQIVKRKLSCANDILAEINTLRRVNHRHIVSLFETYEDDKQIVLVMELVTGGEMFDRIAARGSYTEEDAAVAVTQVLSAVCYLHAQGIVHRDLKPENILYANAKPTSDIKIADFGLAGALEGDENSMTGMCGTPGYVAPEVLLSKPY
eukprot:Clim_evm79s88 gene=Clim_evmTU79s88